MAYLGISTFASNKINRYLFMQCYRD